jgi:hypothetical protein
MSTMHATVSVRSNFAIHHLRAAVTAAHSAYKVEQANLNAEHGPWFDEMLVSVPVSVVMAGAALEASANEVIQDILDGSSGLSPTKGCKLLLADLKKDRAGNAIDKYRRLALLFDKEPDTGTLSWVDGKVLVAFRNSFMHFKPAWDHQRDIHDGDLVRKLKTRIPIYKPYQSSFQFPYGFMNYGCAKWSVECVLVFSGTFATLLGIKDRFVAEHLDFSLP